MTERLPTAVVAFLQRHHRAFLFFRDDAGVPIGYPMMTMGFFDDHLLFTAYTKSAKVIHARARPEAACLVMADSGAGSAWVSVQGRATVHQPSAAEVDQLVGTSPDDSRVPDTIVHGVRQRLLSGKRTLLRMEVLHVVATGAGVGAVGALDE